MDWDDTVQLRRIVEAVVEESRDHLAGMREGLASAETQINSSLHALAQSRKRLDAMRSDPLFGSHNRTS